MLSNLFQGVSALFSSGGWVMWPLLVLSLISLTLSFERLFYWSITHRPGRGRWLADLADLLRAGDRSGVKAMIARDGSVYARITAGLLERGASDAAAVELVEANRRSFERFSATLTTIITAAPLLGILGTVTGIIQSFRLLGGTLTGADGSPIGDPVTVAGGIAEALITTAFGLIIAMVTLFPYAWFRTSADRCLGRIEALVAAAAQGEKK